MKVSSTNFLNFAPKLVAMVSFFEQSDKRGQIIHQQSCMYLPFCENLVKFCSVHPEIGLEIIIRNIFLILNIFIHQHLLIATNEIKQRNNLN